VLATPRGPETRSKSRRAGAFVAVVLCCVAAGCGDQPSSRRGVQALVEPSPAEREAAVQYAQARTLLDAGDERAAEAALRRALKLSPDHPKALAALGGLLLRRRRFDEATPLLRRCVELDPDDVERRKALYQSLCGRRDFAGAETAARAWIGVARSSGDAWYSLGCALHEQGKLGPAAKALETAGTKQAARGEIRSRLGLVLLAQGKRAQAEAAQRDALQRDPRFVDAWARLGDAIAAAGPSRYGEAVAAYRSGAAAVGADGVHARLYRLLRLMAESDATKTSDADAQWSTLLAIAGREMLPAGGLPAAKTPAADPEREEKALRAAVVASPDDGAARGRYAMCRHRRGDVEAALPEYAEAARAAPADATIRAAYGAALLVADDVEGARTQLAEATRLDPSNALASRNLGWALLRLGRDAESIAAYDRALATSKDDRLARRGRGLAKMHAGRLDEGLKDVVESGWGGR
jgi:tetratricopeptide (TPR) repeat protein